MIVDVLICVGAAVLLIAFALVVPARQFCVCPRRRGVIHHPGGVTVCGDCGFLAKEQ